MFIRGLSIDWNEVGPDSYLRHIEAINALDYLPFHQPITFFVGENGSGKSTLLEAIAIAYGFNPEHDRRKETDHRYLQRTDHYPDAESEDYQQDR